MPWVGEAQGESGMVPFTEMPPKSRYGALESTVNTEKPSSVYSAASPSDLREEQSPSPPSLTGRTDRPTSMLTAFAWGSGPCSCSSRERQCSPLAVLVRLSRKTHDESLFTGW